MIGRCRHRSDFEALRRGRRVGGQSLWMRFALDPEVERPLVAFAIGRRAGTAVQRNLIRRRVQGALRELHEELPPGRYLFGCHHSAKAVTFERVVADVQRFVDRVQKSDPQRRAAS